MNKRLDEIAANALHAVTGGKDAYAQPLPGGDQALINNGVSWMNQNFGAGWSSGVAHHQFLKIGSMGPGRPTVYANNGDHTAEVLMNGSSQQALQRLH